MKAKIISIPKSFFMILILTACYGAIANNHNHNISTSPIGAAIGYANLEYSYKIAKYLTIGILGSSGKAKSFEFDVEGTSYGLISRLYFSPAFQNDSWYLVGSVSQINHEATVVSEGITYTGVVDKSAVGGGVGYHWFWKNFNLNLGLTVSDQSKVELKDESGSKYKNDLNPQLGGEFDIGWKF